MSFQTALDKLQGKKAVPVDLMTWARWLGECDETGKPKKVVAQTKGEVGLMVSTVFLGLDHSFGDGPPLLYETMIFGLNNPHDEYQERCSTWEEAEAMHTKACQLVGLSSPFAAGGRDK